MYVKIGSSVVRRSLRLGIPYRTLVFSVSVSAFLSSNGYAETAAFVLAIPQYSGVILSSVVMVVNLVLCI